MITDAQEFVQWVSKEYGPEISKACEERVSGNESISVELADEVLSQALADHQAMARSNLATFCSHPLDSTPRPFTFDPSMRRKP